MHILKYKKLPKQLRESYQSHIAVEKVQSVRIMCVLGLALYLAFMIVDIYAMPSKVYEALIIRFVVITGFLIAFALTYHKKYINYYNLIQPAPYLLAAIGIIFMIYLADSQEIASNVYFAGLILVIMVLFSWSHLELPYLVVNTVAIVGTYIYAELIKYNFELAILLPILITNLFFIFSASIIGFVSLIIRDNYLKENFLLQQSLKKSVKEKTIEANDYEYQANHDALTLLPNRRYITQLLEESLEIAKEKDKILAILFFDLNGFKQLNDVYGHAVGDEVLVIVAKRLELAIRKGDAISRLGGDEYLVGLLIDRDHATEVNTMAAKFTAIISEPMNIDGNIFKVGASVGIAAYPIHGNNVNVLIDIADKKMYKIKKGLQKLAKERDNNKSSEAVVIFPGNSKSRQ